ncbi:MAG: TolC family protein [Candidatus Nitrotoga sp.]|nr:TolC family protein [Candidatus Nitrotoga sp.]
MESTKNRYTLKIPLIWLILILVTLLAGCANFSKDGGFSQVEKITMEKSGMDIQWARSSQDRYLIDSRIDELLSKPLAVEDAVQIALLNNKELQAEFYELGISEADLVQAGRLPNPRFAMLYGRNSGDYKIEQSFTFNIFSLLTMPRAVEIEKRRFEETQKKISVKVLRLANETRKAYITALAAKQSIQYMQQVKNAAEASSELARKMAVAGNFNKLDQAREQSFYADAALGLARALQAKTVATERLTRFMSLWGIDVHYQLPERLPDLPAKAEELPEIEKFAMGQRLDLQSMKLRTEALGAQLGLTKTTRFINVLELGPARVQEGDRGDPYKKGFEIAFEVPIFDWGAARVGRAESIYMQAVNQLSAAAIDARSEVRESYFRYRSSYDIARHYRDEIVPLLKRILEENQLRYNGMLVSVFDLLAEARSQVVSVNSYIESLRDFWLAQSNMEMSLIGKPSFSESNTS